MREINDEGIAVLRGYIDIRRLSELRTVVDSAFRAVEAGPVSPKHYQYHRFSNSLLLAPICDGAGLDADVLVTGLPGLLTPVFGKPVRVNFRQCWARKKYPLAAAPPEHAPNTWHQDGALGVQFSPEPGDTPPMTPLITCWIPLDPCGQDRPSLEFVRRPLTQLLHYTELDDDSLRRRFAGNEFCSPELAPGDCVIFLSGTLHRTQVTGNLLRPRLSVEYRFVPAV